MFKVTNSESYVMSIIIDHKKQRCHDDSAVIMLSMAPSVIMTVTGSSCKKSVPIAVGYHSDPINIYTGSEIISACPGLTRSATELCGR